MRRHRSVGTGSRPGSCSLRTPLGPVLAVLGGLCGVQPAAAVERYVDAVLGADSNPADCTDPVRPCRTITRVLQSQMLVAGDRIVAFPGSYSAGETFPIVLRKGVTLVGRDGPGATKIVDVTAASATAAVDITVDSTVDDVTGIEGFTIDGAGLPENGFGVLISSTAEETSPGGQAYVRNCVLKRFNEAAIGLATWGCCMTTSGRRNLLQAVVEQNVILGNEPGAPRLPIGIEVMAIAQDLTVATDQSLLRNNVIRGCGRGIVLQTLSVATPTGLARVETAVRHNTILDSAGDGVWLASFDATSQGPLPSVEADLVNNIIFGSGEHGIREHPGDGSARFLQADVRNFVANDLWGNTLGGYYDADTRSTFSSSRELNVIPDLLSASSRNVSLEPLLDAAGRLRLGSPCRDQAVPGAALDDVDGQPRPAGSGPDIGADEVLPLLRGAATRLFPLTPPRAVLFGSLGEYLSAPRSAFPDPDAGVLTDAARPLVVYRLDADVTLRLVKDPLSLTVDIAY